MTLEERDLKLNRLETLLEKPADDETELARQLCEIWLDRLWEVSDDSFEEFLGNEFEMTESAAITKMKLAAGEGVFTPEVTEKIDLEFERLG